MNCRKCYLSVDGTDIEIPYIDIGKQEEKISAVITAGIHSAEYVGIQAAIELADELGIEGVNGRVIIIPLCNRSGFEHRTMSMVYEDGLNLNRVFPGTHEGTTSERIAFSLFTKIITKAGLLIDLHSGDGYEDLYPYVYYLGGAKAEAASKKMVECVNVTYYVRSNSFSGGAYNQASIYGIPSVLIERGGQSLYTREQIEADKKDVKNILKRFGILSGSFEVFSKKEVTELDDDSPCTGCWYPKKKPGDIFEEGEVLGEIRDYFGSVIYRHIAGTRGVILHQVAGLNIIKGDPMIAYGIWE